MKVLGHRGCIYEPENTIRSFKKAFDLGADGVELDTQVTSDGVVVVSHDENLLRLTGNNFSIRQHTYNDLLSHRIEGETIPLLVDVLALAKEENKLVDVELKNPSDFIYVAKIVEGFNYEGFFISSFFHRCLFEGKKSFPKVKFGYLYAHEPRDIGAYATEIDILKPEIGYVTEDYRKYASITIPWTVNEKSELKRLLDLGVFAIITDVADKVLEYIKGSEDGEKDGSPYLEYLLKAVVKDESSIVGDRVILALQNRFMSLHLDGITVDGESVISYSALPFHWKIGDKIVVELQGITNSSIMIINTKELGSIRVEVLKLLTKISLKYPLDKF